MSSGTRESRQIGLPKGQKEVENEVLKKREEEDKTYVSRQSEVLKSKSSR